MLCAIVIHRCKRAALVLLCNWILCNNRAHTVCIIVSCVTWLPSDELTRIVAPETARVVRASPDHCMSCFRCHNAARHQFDEISIREPCGELPVVNWRIGRVARTDSQHDTFHCSFFPVRLSRQLAVPAIDQRPRTKQRRRTQEFEKCGITLWKGRSNRLVSWNSRR
jgi:hypothetical protein